MPKSKKNQSHSQENNFFELSEEKKRQRSVTNTTAVAVPGQHFVKNILLPNHDKRCVVIGNTRLCVFALEQLIASGWSVLNVVSEDEIVELYCNSNKLELVKKLDQVESRNFILLSVVNYAIIPATFLNSRDVILAINYHDSLLPKYAGLNSTTWAIYNNETTHGVSWHVISSKVDEGGIIKQSSLKISINETALSLNIKCFEEASKLFVFLLKDLENGNIEITEQDITKKTYYGKDHVFENYGLIDFTDNFEQINRIYRSLYFGEKNYINPVTSVKIWDGEKAYLIESLDFHEHVGAVPGHVYSISESVLSIGIKGGKLSIKNLKTLEGKPISIHKTNFRIGRLIDSCKIDKSDETILSKIKNDESKTLKLLKSENWRTTTFFRSESIANDNNECQFSLPLNKIDSKTALCKVAFTLRKFITDDLCIPIEICNPFKSKILNELIRQESFVCLKLSQKHYSYVDFAEFIKNKCDAKYLVPKDFLNRSHLDAICDVRIFLSKDNHCNNINNTDFHRLSITISEENIYINGYQQDKILLDSFCSSLHSTLHGMDEKDDICIQSSPSISPQDQKFNNLALRKRESFLECFEKRVRITPKAIAVIHEDKEIDYDTLNRAANRFARHLQKLGATSETLIGIGLDRSIELIIALLGVLKSGSVFLPLDTRHPQERLQFMLEDSGAEILITHSFQKAFGNFQGKKVFLDRDLEEICTQDSRPLNIECTDPDQLAYVLYTSGSTGKPKGVEIGRTALNTFLATMQHQLKLSSLDRWLALTTISFDISILEILLPLRQGSTVVLGSRDVAMDPVLLAQTLKKKNITFVQATPATWQMLIDVKWRGNPKLTILCGGEALSQKLAHRLAQLSHTLWNMYGPTETTIWSSMKKIKPSTEKITIGGPIANTSFYIFDQEQNVLPVGVPGELYIGGLGLARGYRNRPELTAEKFISSPYGKLYKTGDLARYLPNGEIDFLGRIDTQVKIHGYRIELGEIEELLNKCSDVKQAVVVTREEKPGDFRIVAYYRGEADKRKLEEILGSHLPSYMVPSVYVQVAEFPLNTNGKIDRKALPVPNYELGKSVYVAPNNPIEAEVIKVFETILNISGVGSEDNFFALGGHSLLAARVVTKLTHFFQSHLSLKTLFEKPTASLLAKEIQHALLSIRKVDRILKTEDGKTVGLSPSQQGLWFLSHQTPKSALYNIPFSLELTGDLDISSLQQALHTIVERHEILRTVFLEGAERVESVILECNETPLCYEDLRGSANPQIEADRVIALEAKKPFDLSQGFLFRFLLLRLSKLKHRLFLNFHHMVFDGHSANLFIHEFKALYEAYKTGKQNPLEELSIQYNDYTSWSLKQPAKNEHISWWCNNLQDAPAVLNLPIDRPRPPIQTYRGAVVEFPIAGITDIQALKKFAQMHESTLFAVLLSSFHVLLARYTSQNDFVVGVPVSGRTHSDLDHLMGCFVHTLPVRTRSSGDISFTELIRSIRNDCLKTFDNQSITFERIVHELKLERSLSYSPVFQTMFNMLPKMDIEKIENLKVHLSQIDRDMAHFDLSLSIQETPEGISGIFEYNTDLFLRKTIERMAKHFQNLTKVVLASPDVAIGKIEILGESEIHKITVEWNKQPIAYSTRDTILQLIEKSADKWPDALAVVCGDKNYTYSQLNNEANRIAHILLAKGLKKEDKIAVCLERSAAFIPAILGILKSGGAYVPLDPLEPQERMDAKLEELRPLCVLTQKALKDRFPQQLTFCMDAMPPASIENPRIPISNDQLAYMIYTSGTTGNPKGVEIEHKSINDRVLWKQAAYPLNSDDVMLHTYSFIFDGSIINYFWPLCSGARVVIATKAEQVDSAALIELVKKHNVTTVDLLPSLLHGLVDEKEFSLCSSLKNIFSGGEILPTDLVRSFFSKSSARLHNTYGPTEATVEASVWECEPEYQGTIAPIGKPIAGAKLYILDSNGSHVPEGVCGELHIGGLGLARGYFNDPIATRERFIFDRIRGERLYRTGDLVKYLSDGTIEFLGRVDSHQVKIRGYRIDLREIESALMRMDPIEKAIVVAKGEADHKRLVAYVKISPPMDEAVLFELMKRSLSGSLPLYMIPQQACILEEFPVLLNGKIDIKSLPEPQALDKKDVIKRKVKNKLEQRLLSIWKEVLDLPAIYVDDNFFEIGGNSLLAMRLMVKIRNQIGPAIPLIQFFQNPTIEGLAQSIKNKENERPWSPLVPMRNKGYKEPFFCVHPVGGGVICYNSLVKHWGEDRPFYAFQARGLEEGQLPHDSIEKMAAEYIRAMRQVQKTGPYFLGGWSFGGFIAAEMAKQLRQMGEKVSRLVLIDTTANIEKFRKIDTDDESLLLSELSQHYKTKPTMGSDLSFREQLARFLDNGGKRAIRKTKNSQPVDRLVSLAKANYRAMKKFSIPFLDVDVFLLKTESNLEKDLGWDHYAKNITVLPVPGDHWAITQDQKACDYAQVLQQCLEVQQKELEGTTTALVDRRR